MARSLQTLFIGILWILTTGTLQWTLAESHICPLKVTEREEQTRRCAEFMTMTMQRYFLDKEKSFPGQTEEHIQSEITKYLNVYNKNLAPKTCYFYRKIDREVDGCCSGWTNGTSICDTPVCGDGCKNGGSCLKPGVCECQSGYTGLACEDLAEYAAGDLRYCYKGPTCHNSAKTLDGVPVSQEQCCNSPDAYSWGVGSISCMECIKTGASGVITQENSLNFRTCLNFGTNYYRTFDGLQFSFGGRCTYTMAMSEHWDVQMQVINCNLFDTCRKRITLVIGKEKIVFENGMVWCGDKEFPLEDQKPRATDNGDCTIYSKGDFIFCECSRGIRLKVDSLSTVYITVVKDQVAPESLKGICGNFNDDANDDLQTRTGMKSTNPVYVANSWAVANEANECPSAGSQPDYCKTAADKNLAEQVCSTMMSGIFGECHKLMSPYFLYHLCINEVCNNKDNADMIKCEFTSRFAQSCASLDVIVFWRSPNFCPKTCENGKVYQECSSKCPRTCKTLYTVMPDSCMQDCVPGCECPIGQFIQDGKCVAAEDCECQFDKKSYKTNETVKNGCNLCKCNMGRWQCTEDKCSEMCELVGINHVRTLDNYEYSFNPGSLCEFKVVSPYPANVALTDPRADLHIDLETDKCNNMKSGYYCLSKVIVTYRGTKVTLSGSSVTVRTNGGDTSDLSADIDNKPYHTKHIYIKAPSRQYRLVKGFGFKILYDQKRALYVYLAPYFAKKVYGLCGYYNYRQDDDLTTISGLPELNPYSFVKKICNAECDVKEPANEIIIESENTIAEAECVYLNPAAKDSIFKYCIEATYDKIQYYHDRCVADTNLRSKTTEKSTICDMVAAFARVCSLADVQVKWYQYGDLQTNCASVSCTNIGQGGEIYQECGRLCKSTCRDFEINDVSCEDECIPGCQCEPGTYRDDYGSCVNIEQCTCYDMYNLQQKVWPAGSNITRQCSTCTCQNGAWDCDNDSCEDITCPKNQEYIDSESICEAKVTCATYDLKASCSDATTRFRGCGCKGGTVMAPDGTCVEPDRCPCMYGMDYFDEGEEITVKCNKMKCQNRKFIKVGQVDCPGVCWVYGDPHYVTFDGKHYMFQGACRYVLAKAINGDFSVVVGNMPCGSTGVTCTKNAEITIKGIKMHLIRGSAVKIGNTTLNEQYISEGLEVATYSYWTSIVAKTLGIEIMWDGGTRMKISLDKKWMNGVEGLCGNFDGESESLDYKKPDGSQGVSANDFAMSWSADSTCDDKTASGSNNTVPTGPCTGDLQYRKEWAQSSCSIIYSDVFKDCRGAISSSDVNKFHESCLYDSCSCDKGGDCECLCTAVAAFGEQCNQAGAPAKWRNPRFCPIMCPLGFEYKACAKPCPQTCENVGDEPDPWCKRTYCIEGCFCPDGTVQDGNKCVPANECPCMHNHKPYPPGTHITSDCMNCTCINGKFECIGTSCKETCIDQFACKNGDCIDQKYRCDKHSDCMDGSDEVNCTYTCQANEMSCDDGRKCVANGYRCDGMSDCLDSTDEMNCGFKCDKTQFTCDSGKCINMKYVCDKYPDCGIDDNSDEKNCNGTVCAPIREFKCANANGMKPCEPINHKCDGHDDCGDGSDEENCKCTCDDFSCADCICVNNATQCDGIPQCNDGSDEYNCPCIEGQFTCSDGTCVNGTTVCEGTCADGSMPPYCLETTTLSTTLPTTTEMTTTHVSTTTIVSTPTSTGSTTTIVSTPSTTTTEYCVHIELMSDNINIPLSKLITPNNPGLSDEDKEKLRPNNQEFLNVYGGTFLVRLENIDAEITDITIEGSNIAEITVKYDDVLDNIESTTLLGTFSAGEKIPLTPKLYELIRISITGDSSSLPITINALQVGGCAKIGTTTATESTTTSLPSPRHTSTTPAVRLK